MDHKKRKATQVPPDSELAGSSDSLMSALQIEQDKFEAENPNLQKMSPEEFLKRFKTLTSRKPASTSK